MLPDLLEILGSLVVIVIGLFYLIRIIYDHKLGKKIWDVYDQVSEEKNLSVKKSLNLISDWPNIFGRIDDRRVYVHPDRGGRKDTAKTIIAVENKLDLFGGIIINTPDVGQPKDTQELEVKNISKYKLDIYSREDVDEERINDLISSDASRKINDLIESNRDDFRALIIEPGISMFSTFKIEMDSEKISKNLDELLEIVEFLEASKDHLSEEVESLRMTHLSEGAKHSHVKALLPILFLGIGSYLIYRLMHGFSFFFMITGTVLVLLGVTKLYLFIYNERRYQ